MLPAFLRPHFSLPSRGQAWNLSGDCRVFRIIGQSTALRQGPKTMEILAWSLHIVRIERKHGIRRRILPYPRKCLQPFVPETLARPFHVLGCGKSLTLSYEHTQGQRDE